MPENKAETDKTTVWIPKSIHKVLKQKALDKDKSIERILTDILEANLTNLMNPKITKNKTEKKSKE